MAEKEEKKEEKAETPAKESKKEEKVEKEKTSKKEEKSSKSSKKAEEAEKEEAPKKKAKKKSRKRTVAEGNAYVQASYNNTIVTLTEPNGNVISWSSAGSNGFKGARKATPYAAQVSAENAVEKAKLYGLERVHVYVKGVGTGRDQAVRGLIAGGLDLLSITDITPIPHNGCRKKKTRRV